MDLRWLDSEALQDITLVAIPILGVAALVVLRFVHRFVIKVLLLAVIAALGFAAWNARVELRRCANTCGCELYGREIRVPRDGC